LWSEATDQPTTGILAGGRVVRILGFGIVCARVWFRRAACIALVFAVVSSAAGERPEDKPPRPGERGPKPATIAGSTTIAGSATIAVNRVILMLQDNGEIGAAASSVAAGGFWKSKDEPYIFSSGINVGARDPGGTIYFANGGPFSELTPGSPRFPQLDVFWDSQSPLDRLSYPQVCTVDAPRVARFPDLAPFVGEPFPGFADRTLCIAANDITGSTCGECAGTRLGVTIVQAIFGFSIPTMQDIVFVAIRIYNDTRFINAANSPNQAPGPHHFVNAHFAFAADPDVGVASDDQITFLPDIQTMAFWDHDFSERTFQRPPGIGGIGLVVSPRDPVTGEEILLESFTLFTSGAPRPFPNDKEVWYGIMEGDPRELFLVGEPRDQRAMVSSDRFTLPPDQFIDMIAVYFFADVEGTPPADLRGEPYINLATGRLNPDANDDPAFDAFRRQARVASAVANAGFIAAMGPASPDFEQIAGDHQITIAWDEAPVTAPSPFASIARAPFDPENPRPTGIFLAPGDVVFFGNRFQTAAEAGIAGREATNLAFNPDFVIFDFEGFRVYRSRTGRAEDAELIAQFDLANDIAGGLFCVEAVPFFDAEVNFIQNVCTETAVQPGPSGRGEGEAARFGSNTGLQFSVVDRGGSFPDPADGPGLINGIPVAHAVTSFAVQCGILLPTIPRGTETAPPAACLSLESARVFKVAFPESDPSSVIPAEADLTKISVVPNPFIVMNELSQGRGLHRILFTNLPPVATIRIYTISGNLVRILDHNDGSGTEDYDVRTRHDLPLASGNYYWHVTTPDGRTRLGRFAVIN